MWGDADVEEAAYLIGVARCLERCGRLVVGWSACEIDDDPAVCERDDRGFAREHGLAPEHVGVEVPGPLHIVGDDEVGEHDALCECRECGGRLSVDQWAHLDGAAYAGGWDPCCQLDRLLEVGRLVEVVAVE